jgi:hypothetical protein
MHLKMLRIVSEPRPAPAFFPESVFIVSDLIFLRRKSIYDAAFIGKFLKFE